MRTLYVSAFLPEKIAKHAGGRVAYENLQSLLAEGHEVDVVVCTTEEDEPSAASHAVVRQGWRGLMKYLAQHIGRMSWRNVFTAPHLHTRLNAEFAQTLCKLVSTNKYSRVFVDFTQTIFVVKRCLEEAGVKTPVTACIHDVFAQKLLRAQGVVNDLLTGFVMKEEQRLLSTVNQLVVLNDKDEWLLRHLYNLDNITIKPFTPPDWCSHVVRTEQGRTGTNILFFANFERPENSRAALWFIDGPFAEIQRGIGSATLTLAGTGSDRLVERSAKRPGVSGTGFVEDPSAAFGCCRCAIAPLFEGAGVKFKVLEALACGVTVVGTKVAFEGIPHSDLMVVASADEFADKVSALLQAN